MTRPGGGEGGGGGEGTGRAGIEPRSAVLEVDALPLGQRGGRRG